MLSVMVVLSDLLCQEHSANILGNLNNSPEDPQPKAPIVNQEYAVVSHKM